MMNRTPSTLLSGSQFLQPITITISLSANEKYTSVISHSSPRFVRVDEALADVPRRASGDLVRWILVPVGAAVRVGLILARGVVLLDEPIPQVGALFPLLFTRAVAAPEAEAEPEQRSFWFSFWFSFGFLLIFFGFLPVQNPKP